MKVLRLVLVLSIGWVVAGHTPGAWACSCSVPAGDAQELQDATAAFIGIPFDSEDPSAGDAVVSSGRTITWRFEVEKVVKGRLADPLEVDSAADGVSCGYEFTVGHRYRVYLYEDGEGWATNSCMGNDDLGPSRASSPPASTSSPATSQTPVPVPTQIDGRALGAPLAPEDPGTGLAFGLGAVALATAGGALMFTRRRRAPR